MNSVGRSRSNYFVRTHHSPQKREVVTNCLAPHRFNLKLEALGKGLVRRSDRGGAGSLSLSSRTRQDAGARHQGTLRVPQLGVMETCTTQAACRALPEASSGGERLQREARSSHRKPSGDGGTGPEAQSRRCMRNRREVQGKREEGARMTLRPTT